MSDVGGNAKCWADEIVGASGENSGMKGGVRESGWRGGCWVYAGKTGGNGVER